MSISGRIITTANSDKVVLMSGNMEIITPNIEVYREALKDIKRFMEFEVEIEKIVEDKFFHYDIIVPDNLFQNYEQEEDTHSGGESGEEKG
jgi:hypothetical protein